MVTFEQREACGKLIEYRKDCMDRWEAFLTMGDGFVYSYTLARGIQNGKKVIKEALLNCALAGPHPLPKFGKKK